MQATNWVSVFGPSFSTLLEKPVYATLVEVKMEPLLHQKKLGVLRESGEYKGETIDIKIFDIKYANVKTKVFIWAFQRVSGMWTLGV